jgi:hypothetical protein
MHQTMPKKYEYSGQKGNFHGKIIKSQVNKLAFFLVAHCLIFSHNQPFRLGGGGCTWPEGGGMHKGGGGGMYVHPVHPPWVRHCF